MNRYTVFVIDDSKAILKLVKAFLESANFEVHTFTSAEEAQGRIDASIFNKKDIDLILLDIYLGKGKMDGRDFLDFVLKKKYPIEVLVMSASLNSIEFNDLIMKGAADYIAKPFKEDELVETTRHLANISRKKNEFQRQPWNSIERTQRDVFLSYASSDSSMARGIKKIVERASISVWYAESDMEAGSLWRESLSKAIESCHVFIILLTSDSIQSGNVMAELDKALTIKSKNNEGFLVIPILYRIKLCDIPNKLQDLHCIDFTDEEYRVDSIQVLKSTIENHLKKLGRNK